MECGARALSRKEWRAACRAEPVLLSEVPILRWLGPLPQRPKTEAGGGGQHASP